MLSDEVLDKVIERVTRRIEQSNTYVLEQIGKTINKIGKLTPSKAYQLEQMLKYGGDFDKIVKELARITNLNVNDIYKIFEEVAKSDYQFAKQFYDYRNKKFIPYKDNIALQNEVKAIARQTAQTYLNMANSYAFRTLKNGRYVNTPLSTMYQEVIDKAILSVSQGQNTFQDQMYSTIKELASSGLKTIDYASGRSYRLDSAVRMNLKEGLRTLHNEMQDMLGEEFGADGVEISVHSMPAIDHEEVQGRQFSTNQYDENGNLIKEGEWEKLQGGLEAKDYKGKIYTLDHDGKNGYRPISTMNCYHYIFSIVLGVSEPEYTDKELEKIKQDNDKGFEYDGKHYTLYEGTQLQRNIELELRKAKDTQIMAKASGNMELVGESQARITTLNRKYKELLDASGLPSKLDRARVPGYRRMAMPKQTRIEIPKIEYKVINNEVNKELLNEMYFKSKKISEELPNEEFKSIKRYAGERYKEINETLVLGEPKKLIHYENVGEIKTDIANIDKVMKKNTIDENLITYKGSLADYYEKYNIGDELELSMYNSTSVDIRVAERFARNAYLMEGKEKAILEIRVPKGTNGVFMGDLYRDTNEFEILLDRDLKYKIISKEKIDTSHYEGDIFVRGNEYTKIVMEVVK